MKSTFDDLLKTTELTEKAYIKKIQKEYQAVYNEMKKTLDAYYIKYATDGKFTTAFYKYDRSAKMTAQMIEAFKGVTVTNEPTLVAYLASQYNTNYLGTGFILENKYQIDLAFQHLNQNAVKKAMTTPFNKIALKSNSQQVRIGIERAVTQGIAQGDGIQKMARRVRDKLEDNANNAVKITRTETTRVMNSARLDSMESVQDKGLLLEKEWISTLDSRTRESHGSLDGEIKPLDEPFSNGLMYPGDQTGNASEVINCRCTMTEKLKGLDPKFERRVRTDEGSQVIPPTDYKTWEKERVK